MWKAQGKGMFTVKTCSLALTKRDGQYNAARWRKFWKSETPFESDLFLLDGVSSSMLVSRQPLEEMSPAMKSMISIWRRPKAVTM